MRLLFLLLFWLVPVGAAAQPRRAHLSLNVTVWERGVGAIHSSVSELDLELTLTARTATLSVTGTGHHSSSTLAPHGPSDETVHELRVADRFEGSVTRDGEAYVLLLTRVGSPGLAPRVVHWRCEPATLPGHAGVLGCHSTDPLDPLPWNNGSYLQVPIVLSTDGVHDDVIWDGESEPHASVR